MPKSPDEMDLDAHLVRALLAEQHPDVAGLDLEPLASGWDNTIFRLGDELLVRMPHRALAATLEANEQRWLPELAADLPLPVPVPVRTGRPSEALCYPWPWSLRPWFDGAPIEIAPTRDLEATAASLGSFLAAAHRPAPGDAPANPYRGVPLTDRADWFDRDLVSLGDRVDADAARGCWADLVATPAWAGPPLWLHGDVHPLNLLVHDGRLAAVIDFGDLTSGDPASDLAVAWMLFPPAVRPVFRGAVGDVDDATWARARGWALALGVAMATGDDRVRAIGERAIAAVLTDRG